MSAKYLRNPYLDFDFLLDPEEPTRIFSVNGDQRGYFNLGHGCRWQRNIIALPTSLDVLEGQQ